MTEHGLAENPRRTGSRPADEAVMARFRQYRQTRDRGLRNALIEEHLWLAHVAARRFAGRGEPLDDLMQVALLGILKAVERFDPEYGSTFPTFALPTITGELRRHFRDTTWALRVSRRAKELHLALSATLEALTQELGRSPQADELAQAMGVTVDELLEATEAGNAYRTSPLASRNPGEGGAEDYGVVAFDDQRLGSADLRVALRAVLAGLPERERRIVYLRFFDDLTQTEIAEQVGVSQVHVSRLLRATLGTLRERLGPAVAGDAPDEEAEPD